MTRAEAEAAGWVLHEGRPVQLVDDPEPRVLRGFKSAELTWLAPPLGEPRVLRIEVESVVLGEDLEVRLLDAIERWHENKPDAVTSLLAGASL